MEALLPGEVLERIAEKVGEISTDLLDDSAWSEHYASLRSLCLVARCFRVIAQTLLAESLYIQDEATTNLWLESTATSRHATKTLVINGATGLDLSDSLWESILRKARSVETISTFYILRPRSKRSLAHPALSGTSSMLGSDLVADLPSRIETVAAWLLGCSRPLRRLLPLPTSSTLTQSIPFLPTRRRLLPLHLLRQHARQVVNSSLRRNESLPCRQSAFPDHFSKNRTTLGHPRRSGWSIQSTIGKLPKSSKVEL